MPPKKYSLKVAPEQKGQRLDQVIAAWLPSVLGQPVSKGKVRKLVIAGAVYLNGARVRIASKPVHPGAKIDVYVDLAKLNSDERSQDIQFTMGPKHILFEDEHLIAVNKPPGLPTQPTVDEARDNLYFAVKKFIAQRDEVQDPYLGLHHRLDRDTSGVILFTKTKAANPGVADSFSKHLAQKTYLALVTRPAGPVPEEWQVKNYLGKVARLGKKTQFGAVKSGGDFAHTDFKLIERLPGVLLIEAKPRTGRTHQIRVHLAEKGTPILGDATYGGETSRAPRLMLHAARLTLKHPLSQNEISFESPLPEDFSQCLLESRKSSSKKAP